MVTQEQQSIIDHAQLQKINGWQHIKVKGTPYECGFQEGYLLADEYKDALRVYKFMTLETFGMTYEWFAEQALKLHRDKIPTRWLEELRGLRNRVRCTWLRHESLHFVTIRNRALLRGARVTVVRRRTACGGGFAALAAGWDCCFSISIVFFSVNGLQLMEIRAGQLRDLA